GSLINASGADFDSSGKGGSVALETRGTAGGMLDLQQGSAINLSVATATFGSKPGDPHFTSEAAGHFTGTLHLRAPRISGGSEIAVTALNSTVTNASQVIVEGYQTYDLTSSGGAVTTAVQNQVKTDATGFIGNADSIESRILAGSSSDLGSILTVRPGAEIINTTGDLTLGSATASAAQGDWDLSTFRFGGEQVPGILTMRAAGNLVFFNSLSDGFTSSTYTSDLLANNAALSDNAESWSYRLVAGADFSAADTRQVVAQKFAADAALGTAAGSVKLGKIANNTLISGTTGAGVKTSTLLNSTSSAPGYFQVIRTGSGDIDVVAGGDVQLLNIFASIYTAGTQVADATMGGAFQIPQNELLGGNQGSLGAIQQPSTPVQYTLGGGDVSLSAGNDIIHLARIQDPTSTTAKLIFVQDSQKEMPTNWLYRRGYVDPATGEFGISHYGESASTSWWVDFTNFFEGAGALGGGNVTLTAGRDVSNVDAVAPTNARMPAGVPDASKLVELGGGDVNVIAGRNIDAGVYYVERGRGALVAGGSIITNSTRSPSFGQPGATAAIDSLAWLPTTLFVGKGSFDVSAADSVLLGPVANPSLLPQGFNNSYWNKTWFSTYAQDDSVSVSALGGSINLRQAVTLADGLSYSTLQAWYQTQLVLNTAQRSASYYQPWLRLTESLVSPYTYAFNLMPGTLKMTSFSGDVALTGGITLAPSKTGTLEIMAAGSVNGFNAQGTDTLKNKVWASSLINLSDADPSALPEIADPFGYQQLVGNVNNLAWTTQVNFLNSTASLFIETGSTDGALQERQSRHSVDAQGHLLHQDDKDPLRIYSGSGDISGLTLFSAKFAEILSGQDLRDISLYIQNNTAQDISIVSASRDIIAYDINTDGRIQSRATGNIGGAAAAGDIQISGGGTLEVFAGRNLDLGVGPNNADGTGVGITSIGNARNPYLAFGGADIIAAAGIGDASSLDTSKADFAAFITKFVNNDEGTAHLKELGLTPQQFGDLDSEAQKQAALQIFYLVLRDTGRNYNDPDSEHFGTYDQGKDAVATLFPGTTWSGNIDTRSRNIRTRSGGDITLLAPGGSLSLAQSVIGSPLVPPGIITEAGGNINIFTDKNVELGISRIFTLRGGNEIIWSTHGDIAAGSSSKTIQSAPPTRVLIDPQSGDVKTDLAGLATGGGIGVLSTVAGVKPADVDLIAPEGTIDAGDAGIRVSGNLNIAAAVVVNASNISVGGSSSGATATVSAPSVSALTSASNAAAAAGVTETTQNQQNTTPETTAATIQAPSDISVEVVGYGGDDEGGGSEEDKDKDKKKQEEESQGPTGEEGH
ncbi:MAG: hypothetical protein JWO82_2607, partial [Akkermansiaceae bacterium]|nr:hypothetical protein [Akkermansiaceae bacterium]